MKHKSKKINDPQIRRLQNISSNPIWQSISKSPVSANKFVALTLPVRKALYALSESFGEKRHFDELVITAFTSLVLSEKGFGNEYTNDIHGYIEILKATRQKREIDQYFELNETCRIEISQLVHLYEQQIQIADRHLLASSILEGFKRASAHSLL